MVERGQGAALGSGGPNAAQEQPQEEHCRQREQCKGPEAGAAWCFPELVCGEREVWRGGGNVTEGRLEVDGVWGQALARSW